MSQKYVTKLLIIGSGSAGLTAAIYSARAALNPLVLSGFEEGGQLTTTNEVENFPGFAEIITGPCLMDQMKKQAIKVGTKILNDEAISVDLTSKPFKVETALGDMIEADSVIVATGAQAKWLGLESESKFQGFGVSGCATCDGSFFKDQTVLVIGGGNTAVEEALYLINHAKKIFLIHRRDRFRAEQILQNRLFASSKIHVIWNSVLDEILGENNPKSVTSARITNLHTGDSSEIECSGVFIAIGHKPNTALFQNQLDIDSEGYIITKSDSTKTSVEGVFAAGDVQDKKFRQAVTAAGTGCMAAMEAGYFLRG